MDCYYCKQRIANVVSSRSPQDNFVRLAKECCGNCGTGCGNNQVFHPDYSVHTQQVWMEAIRWAASQLSLFSMRADHLECQNKALQQVYEEAERQLCQVRKAIEKVKAAPNRTYEATAVNELKTVLNITPLCRHEEEAKRLDEKLSDASKFIDSALGEGPDCDCGAEGHICGWPKWKVAAREFIDAELRRRASGEGREG